MKTTKDRKNFFIMLCVLNVCAFSLALFLIFYFSNTAFAHSSAEVKSTFMASSAEDVVEIKLQGDTPQPDDPDTPDDPNVPALSVPFTYRGRRRLNIRSTPGFGNNIIGKIYPGTWGVITGVADDKWMHVAYNGTEGYSYTYYLIYDKSLINP